MARAGCVPRAEGDIFVKRVVVVLTLWAMGLACLLTVVVLPANPASAGLPAAMPAAVAAATTPGVLTSVTPSRLLDTRSGLGSAPAAVVPDGTVRLQVTGHGGVPAGASAVVVNVTVTAPTQPGFLTVYGDGTTRPDVSNLNFVAAQTVPNLVIAPVGADGKIDLYNGSGGTIQLMADVSGYFLLGAPAVAGAFGSVLPSRVLDTRTGIGAPAAAVAAGGTVHLQVAGRGDVPANVSAVVLNVTATASTQPGFVTVYGDGTSRPGVSNLNFLAAHSVSNLVIAPVGANGVVDLYNGPGGTVHFLADVFGYFLSGAPSVAGAFASLAPSRLLDTRAGVGAPRLAVAAGGTVHLQVAGVGGVPASGVSSVVVNVTVTTATKPGYVTVYRDGSALPGTSNLNFAAAQTVPNLVIAAVGSNGKVDLYNGSSGTIQLVADASGWISATTHIASTVTNFNPSGQQITKFDTDGNGIDAHDGDLMYFAGTYYLYGTSYSCGYQLMVLGAPFCGFKSYSSVDLVNWTYDGFLFDASTPAWQASCAPPHYGCYRPHVLFNSLTGKYVLWINSYDSASGYHVLTADTPTGPFTEQAQPVLANMGTPGTYVNGDFTLFQDDDGSAYINYSFINVPAQSPGQGNHILRVQKLNSSYTSGVVGAVASPGASGVEALSLFKKDGTYYMIYGPDCAYCGGTSTLYKTASAVLGTWSAPKLLNTTSCGGQPSFVSKLPTSSGGWTYAYASDLWHSIPGQARFLNQALANYYWAPLALSGTIIQPFGCSDTAAIDTASSATGHVNLPVDVDQTSGPANYRSWSDISSGLTRAQGFTAGRSGILTSFSVATFQQRTPNAGLSTSIYNAGANGAPTGPALYTNAVPASSVGWSPRTLVATPNIAVTAGARYIIVISSSSTSGSYGWEFSDNNPYATGGELYRAGGGAWTKETSRDLDFFTTVR